MKTYYILDNCQFREFKRPSFSKYFFCADPYNALDTYIFNPNHYKVVNGIVNVYNEPIN